MTDAARRIQRTYLTLTLLSTLAASFIWGINTLFLLDAGLSNTQAFAASPSTPEYKYYIATDVLADDTAGTTIDSFTYSSSLAGQDGVSMNRSPDLTAGATFVLHNTISSGKASPGANINGVAF